MARTAEFVQEMRVEGSFGMKDRRTLKDLVSFPYSADFFICFSIMAIF